MSMSGWSLDEMDDIDWNEFQQSNDLIVPDSSYVEERQWTVSGKQWNKLQCQNSSVLAKIAGRRMTGCNNVISEGKVVDPSSSNNKVGQSAQSLNVDMWDVLEDEELARTGYNPMCVNAAIGIDSQKEGVTDDYCKDVKLASVNRDLILGYCKEDPLLADRDATVVNNSCHFLLKDISSPEGELDFFGGEHKNETSNDPLDYSWENISNFEEVDKLFQYSESNLSQPLDSSSDELAWHTSLSSSNSQSKGIQQGLASSSPDARTPKQTSEQYELKMKTVPCESPHFLVLNQKCDSKVDNNQCNDHTLGPNEHLKESPVCHILASQGHAQKGSETLWEEQAWTSTSWNHQQASEFTGNNTGVNNEQDWAARARAWAAAKAAMEAQQAQPQFTPLGRTAEHQVYQDHYSQPVQTQFSEVHQPSLPAVGHQNVQLPSVPVPNMATNQAQDFTTHYHTDLSSSYNHDGFMSYSLKDGAATHEQNASVNSSQGSIPTISPSYSQEMVTNYTSVSGVEEQVKPRQTSHSPLSSPMTLVQDDQLSQVQVQSASTTQIPSQSTQQPHFTYSDQQVPPAHEVNHQQAEFEHVGQDYHQLQQSGYLQPVPTVAMEGQEYNGPPPSVAGWPQLGGPSAPFPSVPPVLSSSHQFDHPYMSVPHPIPGPPAHLFGRVPGPQPGPGFRPNMPPIGGPFGMGPGSPGLPPGPAGMVGPAFMGENNGAFGVPERPKKASVPNWLREELMKKKAAVVANTSAQGLPSEDSFHASGSEDANRSFRKADLTDSKSIDSGRSSDDEDDEEDELEAARTAAINQEIKRVLTEVLLKVTDDLFDEIAEEVLDEDDHSAQVKKHVASDRGRMRIFSKSSPPPPPVQTPMASARVLVSASNATSGNGDDTEKSNSSAPGENLLGLANYASDEDDETVQTRQHVSSQSPEQQEGGLLEDGNREEHGGQVIAGEKSVDEKSKDDRQVDAGEYHDNPRSKGQAKDVVVNKDAGVAAEEHEKLKETLIPHAPKSVDKERHQASSKFAHSEIFFDKGRPNDLKDREIKSKGNDKHDIRKGVSVVNSEPGEIKSKKGDSKQVDFSQHRKDGEKDREKEKEKDREREREKDREKVKEREKIRVGDKKRDKIRDQEGRKGSDKESRKDHEKEKRTAEKIDDGKKIDKERGEKNGKGRQRDNKDTGKNRKRSSSVSSRGRNGKFDSYDSNNSSSGANETENTKRRRVRSSRRSSSPSPIRSRKRQVSRSRSRSRSSHARHSHRRHSPYPSHEGRRKQSRSGSPVRRRR